MEIANPSRIRKPAIYVPNPCNLTKEEIEEQYEEKYKLTPYVSIIIIENKMEKENEMKEYDIIESRLKSTIDNYIIRKDIENLNEIKFTAEGLSKINGIKQFLKDFRYKGYIVKSNKDTLIINKELGYEN